LLKEDRCVALQNKYKKEGEEEGFGHGMGLYSIDRQQASSLLIVGRRFHLTAPHKRDTHQLRWHGLEQELGASSLLHHLFTEPLVIFSSSLLPPSMSPPRQNNSFPSLRHR
jgi:hypothetical protein